MHFSFCSINPWQRWHNSWRNLKSIILHCQCLHRCFEPEKVNWPWSSCENSFLVLCNAIYCSAFCSQGSTSASGQDFLCRHWNSLTLERLHGGGCGGWGESSQRGRAQGNGQWWKRTHKHTLINAQRWDLGRNTHTHTPHSSSCLLSYPQINHWVVTAVYIWNRLLEQMWLDMSWWVQSHITRSEGSTSHLPTPTFFLPPLLQCSLSLGSWKLTQGRK